MGSFEICVCIKQLPFAVDEITANHTGVSRFSKGGDGRHILLLMYRGFSYCTHYHGQNDSSALKY